MSEVLNVGNHLPRTRKCGSPVASLLGNPFLSARLIRESFSIPFLSRRLSVRTFYLSIFGFVPIPVPPSPFQLIQISLIPLCLSQHSSFSRASAAQITPIHISARPPHTLPRRLAGIRGAFTLPAGSPHPPRPPAPSRCRRQCCIRQPEPRLGESPQSQRCQSVMRLHAVLPRVNAARPCVPQESAGEPATMN